ncbi:MAG: small basic family protein [Clostridia bacterium]|nr:small basic family protein [Clostridia bacterium]
MIPIIGLIIGIVIGIFLPYQIPDAYSMYVAVGLLAALDAVFGGLVASMQGRFVLRTFLTGAFSNALLAILLTFIGDKMGLELYLAPVIAFGVRLFDNFSMLRRLFFNKYSRKGDSE